MDDNETLEKIEIRFFESNVEGQESGFLVCSDELICSNNLIIIS